MSETNRAKSRTRIIQRIVLAGLAFLLFVGVILIIVLRKPPPAAAAPIQARLELAAGEVTVDLGDGPTRAVSGTPLLESAKIKTEKGARALVRLPDGSRLFVRAESALTLGTESVSLEQGEYFLDAPPTDRKPLVHQVGDTAITGAEAGLSIRRDGNGCTIYVARGMATVIAKGGRVEVKAGEQATVVADKPPAVSPVAFWEDWTGGMADDELGSRRSGCGRGQHLRRRRWRHGGQSGAPTRDQSPGGARDGARKASARPRLIRPSSTPANADVEGWYWFTVPEDASVTGFALETNGALVRGRVHRAKGSGSPVLRGQIHRPRSCDSRVGRRAHLSRAHLPGDGRRLTTRRLALRAAQPFHGRKTQLRLPDGARAIQCASANSH